MNIIGTIDSPNESNIRKSVMYYQKTKEWMRKNRAFLLIVVAPTLIVSAYYYLVAANQYQSEAHFIIRTNEVGSSSSSGFGQLLGLTGGVTSSQSEASSVVDFLTSHDAVDALRKNANLVERFRRPEADIVSRLNAANPPPEKLLKYYKKMVGAHFDRDAGIVTLQVRAFRADDAYDLIQRLLALGEQRVNSLNERGYNDSVALARGQLIEAEKAVADIQTRVTDFRQTRGDIDPQGTGSAQIKLISEMDANLAAARAQLTTMGALISHSSPQYIALARQVRSLEAGLAAQSSQTAGGATTTATRLGGYEDLRLQQDFAAKRYDAAAANLEKAREQAQRQQLYLVRVVEPNRPVKSLFPERGRIVLTVFCALLLIYSIGWLIAAGVREHAA